MLVVLAAATSSSAASSAAWSPDALAAAIVALAGAIYVAGSKLADLYEHVADMAARVRALETGDVGPGAGHQAP
jgi:hypothetical protein